MTVYSLEEGGIQVGGPIPDHPLSVFEWTVWVNEMWHHRRVIAPLTFRGPGITVRFYEPNQ